MRLIYFPILILGHSVYCQNFHPALHRAPNTFLTRPNPRRRFERPSPPAYNSLLPSREENSHWNTHPNSEPFIDGASPFPGSPTRNMGSIPLNPRPQFSNFEFSPFEEEQSIVEHEPSDGLVQNAVENPQEREIYTQEKEEETTNLNTEYISPKEPNSHDESVSVKSEDGVENENEGDQIAQNEHNIEFDKGKLLESENYDYVDDGADLKQSEKQEFADNNEYEYEDYSATNDEGAIISQEREIAEQQPSEAININPSGFMQSDTREQNRNAENNAFIKSPSVNQETYYQNAKYTPNEQYKPTINKQILRQPSSPEFQERHSQPSESLTYGNNNPHQISERVQERHNRTPFDQNANVLQDYGSIYEPHLGDGHSKTANFATKKRRPYKPFWESSPPSKDQNYLGGERYPLNDSEAEEPVEEPDRLSLLLLKTKFRCQNMKDGYYADEELDCEVFHFCQDKVRHSWLCPNGASFHQVHLICMPQSEDNICEKSSKFHFVNDYLYKEAEGSHSKNKSYVQRYYPAGYEGGIASLEERQASTGNQATRQTQEDQTFDRDYPQGPRQRIEQIPQHIQSGPNIEQFQQNFEPEYPEESYQFGRNEQRLRRNPNPALQQQSSNQGENPRHSRPGASFLLNEDETVSIRRAPYIHRRLREH